MFYLLLLSDSAYAFYLLADICILTDFTHVFYSFTEISQLVVPLLKLFLHPSYGENMNKLMRR